jgi:formamidopyrimidine-DNA glycosylase
VRRRDVVTGPRGRDALLLGAHSVRALRYGKQLALVAADGRAVCAHLGMSGQLLWRPHAAALAQRDHVHVQWRLEGGEGPGRLVFRDPRRFGGLWAFPSLESLQAARWERLGPDALTIESGALQAGLEGSKRAIKAALLDQAVLAGVGNIYADEALFRAGVHPMRAAASLRTEEVEAIARAVRTTLAEAIEAGGSSLRDYRDAMGVAGSYQGRHAVYGRGGLACAVCGRGLDRGIVAQRTTVWCASCQPAKGG